MTPWLSIKRSKNLGDFFSGGFVTHALIHWHIVDESLIHYHLPPITAYLSIAASVLVGEARAMAL